MKIIENQHLKTSNLIYDVNHSIYKYRGIKKIDNLPFESKTSKRRSKREKTNVYNTVLELHNDLLKNILMNTLLHLMPKEVK